ncbi:hypothetical protein RhiirA1_476760 [Rhizophagus irregularis]|uniref:MULE transposase domain-containing protein n=1 Tax=Rhizophagus irregularis TaxID=588596 RepID=A0A2N0QUP6_9GLOM|nr:hypothetical protein RhiirA1_476760 [Rhizophagus irregularis]
MDSSNLVKSYSGCLKTYSLNFFDGKKTCNACRLSNKNRQVTSCTNRKRQIEEEEHEKIKTNYHICIEDLPEIIVENIIKYKENTHPDSSDTFEVSCFINITEFQNESKVIADNIAEVISEADEYNWIYNTKTENKKGVTYYYLCSQSNELSKKPCKNPDITKQRDRESTDRYNCKERIKILIDETEHITYIVIKHYILHNLPPNVSVPKTNKQFIKDNVDLFSQIIYSQLVTSGIDINIRQKQIHYWWSVYMIKQYKQHENSFISAQDWLNEFNYSTLFIMDSPVHAIAFLTGFEKLLKEQNIIISECDNTNDQKYELYALIVEVNGTGFPLAYLFLEINGESDKDFAQISAAQMTWPEIKIQLCKWHIQRAVETKLKDYRVMTCTNYDEYQANRKFTFIDKQFIPIVSANKKTKIRFCPEEYRPFIWNLMNQHLHLHPLISNSTGESFEIAMGQCIGKVLCDIKKPKVSSNIEEFEECGTGEFEGSGTEEFERSNIEEFEGSDTKESKGISNKMKY